MAAVAIRDQPRVRHLALHPLSDRERRDAILLAPDEKHRHRESIDAMIHQVASGEHRMQRATQNPRVLLVRAQQIARDETGNVRKLVGLQIDEAAQLFAVRWRECRLRHRRRKLKSGTVDEHESPHALRIFGGELHRNPAAHRHRHDIAFFDAHRVAKSADHLLLIGDGVFDVRAITPSESEEIGDEYTM